MLMLLWLISVIAFVIIRLPPGDYLTMYIMQLEAAGADVNEAEVASLRKQYGLDLPGYRQYLKWAGGMFRGDFGRSFDFNEPVAKLIAERLPLTLLISIPTLIFSYIVAIPIGIYSATHQYSVGDYMFTVAGFFGLATPGFSLRTNTHVSLLPVLRLQRRRSVFARVPESRLELRQAGRHAEASSRSHHRDRPGWHGRVLYA